tara:strand:+ start:121 stop:390 length:270 start_codon:yes stop_codon:yes gene_type:complete
MTKDEALKLALEVLKRIDEATPTAMAKLVIPEIEQVLAQSEPEYLAFMDTPQRAWVGLTWSNVPDQWLGNVAFMEGGKWAEKTLKEKNT